MAIRRVQCGVSQKQGWETLPGGAIGCHRSRRSAAGWAAGWAAIFAWAMSTGILSIGILPTQVQSTEVLSPENLSAGQVGTQPVKGPMADQEVATSGAGEQAEAEPRIPVLRWKFDADQQYSLQISQRTRIETNVAGNVVTQAVAQRMKLQWQVLAVDGDMIDVEMRYKEIEFDMETPEGLVKGSTNAELPRIAGGRTRALLLGLLARLEPIIDQPIGMRFDTRGRLHSLTVPPELLEKIRQQPETRVVRQVITAQGVQDMLSDFLIPLPETAVAAWEHQSVMNVAAGVPLSRITQYRLADSGPSASLVRVNFDSEVSFPEQYLVGPTRPTGLGQDGGEVDPTRPRGAEPPFDYDPVSAKWPRIARQDCGGSIQFDATQGLVRQASSKAVLVTEKAYSNALIRTTLDLQVDVQIQRL